jgi:hypothetical protein
VDEDANVNVIANKIVPDATILPDWMANVFDIRAVVPLILLLVKFVKSALLRSVVELIVLYANVAPLKLAYDRSTLFRIQLTILAFVKTDLDKFVPVKS